MTGRDIRPALGGISGVVVTPYDADGEVNRPALARITARVAAAGIHAIVAGGNTGEFYALTGEEVRAVHGAAIEGNADKAVLIAGVGRSLKEAIGLGHDAATAGADALLVHQPLDPFTAPQAQADYFRAVADAVTLPVLAYLRSEALGVADIMAIANHPNILAVKVATANPMRFAECVRASEPGTARWICGLAESWAPTYYALGARGFTSGLVNVEPGRSLAIHAALEAGRYEEARRLVAEIAAFETMRTQYGNGANVTVVKAALELLGEPVGPVRLPGLPELDAPSLAALRGILRGWGLKVVG